MSAFPDAARWRLIEPILEQAWGRPPSERAAFLEHACAHDPALRAEVEALLQADDDAGTFLGAPVRLGDLGGADENGEAGGVEDAEVELRLPGVRVVRRVGAGGMGVVLLAEQQEPIRRRVAVKLVRDRDASRAILARFERERQTLALMNHANIAQVFDAGTAPDGRPYFLMEYVDGVPITDYCDRHRLPLAERLALFRTLCDGVQHAHQRGVLHRDLKPSNILVTTADGRPIVKIIDFGIARALDSEGTDETSVTRTGQLLGTPAYMSPEQAAPGSAGIDTRTDVYALGVVLFELLTGRRPFDRRPGERPDLVDTIRRIREGHLVRPSAALTADAEAATSAARQRSTDPRALVRALRGDLDWIVVRAMERDRARRYQAVSELGADIGRFLSRQPVLAGPPSARYRMGKFVSRHRLGVASAAAIGLALVAASVVSTVGLLRARRAEAAAREEASKATTLNDFLLGVLHSPDPDVQGRDVKIVDALDRAETDAARSFAGRPAVEAGVREMLAMTYQHLGLFDKAAAQHRQAIALLARTNGPDDPRTLRLQTQLVEDQVLQAHFPEAIATGREAVERASRALGDEAPVTLVAKGELAGALRLGGDLKEAEGLARSVRDAAFRHADTDATTTAIALSVLALTIQDEGRFADAEGPAREFVSFVATHFGDDSTETLNARNSLAVLLGQEGKLDLAESTFEEVLAGRQRILGPDHPDTLATLTNIAAIKFMNHHPADAEAMYRDALARAERTLPPGHPIIEDYRSAIGQCLTAEGRCREAIGYLSVAQERLLKGQGPHNAYTQDATRGLIEAFEACGRKADAARMRRLLASAPPSGG